MNDTNIKQTNIVQILDKQILDKQKAPYKHQTAGKQKDSNQQ